MICIEVKRLSCLLAEKANDICVIRIFCRIVKEDALRYYDIRFKVVLCLCYIKRCCLSPSMISCRLHSFLMVKNVGDLVRNFSTQTFASLHALQSMIVDEFKWKRLIASQRSNSAKKEEQLEICCF